jgi:hypothetical protein
VKKCSETSVFNKQRNIRMKQISKRLILAAASLAGVVALTSAPVWAMNGRPVLDPTPIASTDGSTTPGEGASGKNQSGNTLRQKAAELLQTKRQNVKQHTQAQKQKACEAHAAEINRRAANYATAAQRHLDVFNSIFTKVQAFQTDKQLNVSDYDTLVATATDKQAAAQSAADVLKSLDVSIDCTQADPATTVAELKTAVQNARTALQDYRTSIKDVVVALKGASTAHTDKSTSTDTTTTTNTDTGTGGDQ